MTKVLKCLHRRNTRKLRHKDEEDAEALETKIKVDFNTGCRLKRKELHQGNINR